MAKSVGSFNWERGFREPSDFKPWELDTGDDDVDNLRLPPSKEVVTSSTHNFMGLNILRTWPTMYDETNSSHGLPSWWKPQRDVDVLICGGE
jgi:phenol 2-monooxygenase